MRPVIFALLIAIGLTALPGHAQTQEDYMYVQMPDTDGWDVAPYPLNRILADDYPSSAATGPITRIDIWVSFAGYNANTPPLIDGDFTVRLHFDENGHPSCGACWARSYGPTSGNPYQIEYAGEGDQGWLQPDAYREHDHDSFFRISFDTGPNPPAYGGSVWLAVVLPQTNPAIGWKSSDYPRAIEPENDQPAKWAIGSGDNLTWFDITNPLPGGEFGMPLNLAFALIPEPGTLTLLMVGGGAGLVRRRRVID